MILKYNCLSCGREIITRYLMPGDNLTCPQCGSEVTVPQDAAPTDQEPNIFNKHEHPKPWPPHILDGGGILRESIVLPIEEKTSTEPTPWNAFSVLKLILAFIVGLILLSCVLGAIVGLAMAPFYPRGVIAKELYKADFSNVIAYIVTFLSTILPAALIYYSVVKRHHNRFFEALRLVKMTRQELNHYMTIGAGCVAIVFALIGLIMLTGLDKNIPKDMPIMDEFRHGYARLALYTLFALIAPAFEEVLFRGYIFQGLKNSWGVKTAAIIVTALFIMMHAPQLGYSIIMLLILSVAAIALIWVRIKSDSLTKCIVIHQIYNTILLAIVWSTMILFGIDKIAA